VASGLWHRAVWWVSTMCRCNLLPPTSGQRLAHGDVTHSATTHIITLYWRILGSWQLLSWSNQRQCCRVPCVRYWTIFWASLIQFISSHSLNDHVRQDLHSSVSKEVVTMSCIFRHFSLRCRLGAKFRPTFPELHCLPTVRKHA